jgi:hypothetical protein
VKEKEEIIAKYDKKRSTREGGVQRRQQCKVEVAGTFYEVISFFLRIMPLIGILLAQLHLNPHYRIFRNDVASC